MFFANIIPGWHRWRSVKIVRVITWENLNKMGDEMLNTIHSSYLYILYNFSSLNNKKNTYNINLFE